MSFPHVLLCAESSTLKGRRFGNVIIAGAATPLPYAAIARAGRTVAISVPRAAWRAIEPAACRLGAVQRRRMPRSLRSPVAACGTSPDELSR